MPYSNVKRATGGLMELAQAIAVPHEHRPQRVPSFPNLERTAVVPTVATGSVAVGSGDQRDFTLIRSPTFPLWTMTNKSTAAAAIFYTATPGGGAGLGFGELKTNNATIVFPKDPYTAFNVSGGDTTWTGQMLRRYPLARSRDGRVFVPVAAVNGLNSYSSCSVMFATVQTLAATLTFELWDGTGETLFVQANSVCTAGTSLDFSTNSLFGTYAFYRLVSVELTSYTSGTGIVSSFTTGINSGGTNVTPTGAGVWFYGPVFAPPEFNSSRLPYAATRANASGVLLSNVTAVLDKEGTINCARLPRTAAPRAFSGTNANSGSSFTTLIGSVYPKDRYYGPMEKGLYAYTLPDSSTDDFFDCVSDSLAGDGFPMPYFNLESFEYVSLISFADLGGNGSTLAITQDVHLEFRSSSMLFPVGYSTTSLESYHLSQMALAQQGVFFENPIHLSAIGGLIRSAVMKIAPVVAPYAKAAAAAVGNRMISSAVSALNTRMSQVSLGGSRSAPRRAKPPKKGKKVTVQRKKR